MKSDFVAEILRATGSLRSGNPAGATDIIQAALAAGGLGHGAPRRSAGNVGSATPARAGEPHVPFIEGTLVAEGEAPGFTSGFTGEEARRSKRLRRPLGEVLRTLGDGRKRLGLGLEGRLPGMQVPGRTPEVTSPEGAEFRDLTHTCAAGSRRYRLYVPASAGGGLQGLVVMLHGCTQSPEDFAAGTTMNALGEEHRLLVVYPAQTGNDNAMSCWNWFRPGDQMRGAGEPAIIAGLTESVRDQFGITGDRVFVAGLSAGAAMAAIMAETYPDLYAAAGIHSGLAYGSANDVLSAFSAMGGQGTLARQPHRVNDPKGTPRVIVFHGTADATVHPSNAERIVAGLGRAPAGMQQTEHPAGDGRRGYTRIVATAADGAAVYEKWMVEGAPHAWFGGNPIGSYTDPAGPNASAEMVRFFLSERPSAQT